MQKLLQLIPFTFIVCGTELSLADAPPPAQAPAAVNATPAPVENNLRDLEAMTFTCPKAALNMAAREAKQAPTLGSYEFSFFRIATDGHHAQYEVHFKSNVYEEPELKYCVSIYCQQGWDPKNPMAKVELMGDKLTTCGHDAAPPAAIKAGKKAKHK